MRFAGRVRRARLQESKLKLWDLSKPIYSDAIVLPPNKIFDSTIESSLLGEGDDTARRGWQRLCPPADAAAADAFSARAAGVPCHVC